MAFSTITQVLASAVATGGTFTVGYPTGTLKGDFQRGVAHKMAIFANWGGDIISSPTTFTVSLGNTSATITYNGATTLPAGSTVIVQLDKGGPNSYREGIEAQGFPQRTRPVETFLIDLGTPITADADGIFASASITSASPITTMTGALAVSGAVSLDVPRNVVAAWTNTAVMTVTGYDEFGVLMVESSASGTSMTGVKAFKRVTQIAVSANVTSCTVGTGDVLGLPVRLPNAVHIIKEIQDFAAATTGTTVAALAMGTKSTATTADVRGTYDPNAAADGAKSFALIVSVPEGRDRGNPQYGG